MTGILQAVPHGLPPIPPRHPQQPQRPHITLQCGGERADWEGRIGQRFEATVLDECWDARAQALAVELPEGIPCRNQHPHITLSWAKDGQPYDSVAMLAGQHESQPLDWTPLPCRIEWQEWEPQKPVPNWHPCPTCWQQGELRLIRGTLCQSHRPHASRRDVVKAPDLGWQVDLKAAKRGRIAWRLLDASGAVQGEGVAGSRKQAAAAAWGLAQEIEGWCAIARSWIRKAR